MIRLVPDWATWAFTVFPPSPQTSASQSRWAYACRTAKRTVGCSQTRHLYIHTHAHTTHTLDISTNVEGGLANKEPEGETPRQTRFVLKSGVELWCLLSSANKRSPHAVILSLWHSHSLISHNQTWIIIQPRVRATHCLAAFLKSIRPLSSPLLIYTTACTRVCVRLRACVCVCVCEGDSALSLLVMSFDSWIIHSSDSSSASACCQFELNYQFRGHRTAALGSVFTSRYCVVLKPIHLLSSTINGNLISKIAGKNIVNIFILIFDCFLRCKVQLF